MRTQTIRAVGLSTLAVASFLAGSASAQSYFTFPEIPGVGDQPSVQIDLNKQMLSFLLSVTESSGEEEAAEVLAGLDGIRVRVYEDLEDSEAVVNFVDDTSGDLERDGWQRAVFIQDGDERVRMYMQFDEDRVTGMTVMVVDGDEAVFVNVAGMIDPVVLGHLTRQMGINDALEGVGGAFTQELGADGSAATGSEGGSSTAQDSD